METDDKLVIGGVILSVVFMSLLVLLNSLDFMEIIPKDRKQEIYSNFQKKV